MTALSSEDDGADGDCAGGGGLGGPAGGGVGSTTATVTSRTLVERTANPSVAVAVRASAKLEDMVAKGAVESA
eukprot:959731-Prymnesium_polylepis.2